MDSTEKVTEENQEGDHSSKTVSSSIKEFNVSTDLVPNGNQRDDVENVDHKSELLDVADHSKDENENRSKENEERALSTNFAFRVKVNDENSFTPAETESVLPDSRDDQMTSEMSVELNSQNETDKNEADQAASDNVEETGKADVESEDAVEMESEIPGTVSVGDQTTGETIADEIAAAKAVESTDDQPAAERNADATEETIPDQAAAATTNADETVAETNADEKTAETNADETATETNVYETAAVTQTADETVTDQAAAETITDQAAAETNADETAAETNADETAAETNADEIDVETNADEVAVETKADETAAIKNVDQTAAEPNADETAVVTQTADETIADQTAAETITYQAAAETIADQTAAESYANERAAETNADEMAAETNADAMAAETNADEMAAKTNADEMAAETNAGETAAIRNADQTAAETVADQAAEERVADQTAEETVADQAAEERVADQAAEEIVADQAAEDIVADQTAEIRNADEIAAETNADETAAVMNADNTALESSIIADVRLVTEAASVENGIEKTNDEIVPVKSVEIKEINSAVTEAEKHDVEEKMESEVYKPEESQQQENKDGDFSISEAELQITQVKENNYLPVDGDKPKSDIATPDDSKDSPQQEEMKTVLDVSNSEPPSEVQNSEQEKEIHVEDVVVSGDVVRAGKEADTKMEGTTAVVDVHEEKDEPTTSEKMDLESASSKEMAGDIVSPPAADQPLALLFIGRTGSGKTSICQTLSESTDLVTGSTKESTLIETKVDGRDVRLLDTPGTIDNKNEHTLKEISRIFTLNPSGFHAVFYVVKYGVKISNEEFKLVDMLKKLLGADVFGNYVVVAMTNGDRFGEDKEKGVISGEVEDFVDQHQGVLKDLVTECKGRLVIFDTTEKDAAKKREQIGALLSAVDGIISKNDGKRLDNAYFRLARKETEMQTSMMIIGNETEEERIALEERIKEHVGLVVARQIKKDNAWCFPADAVVRLSTGEQVAMDRVKVGDKVLSVADDGRLVHSEVYLIGHAENDVTLPCIRIRTSSSCICLSPGHYIFVNRGAEKMIPVLARQVRPGDVVYVCKTSENTDMKVEVVAEVSSTLCRGRFAPFTDCGTVVVNDVLASCYVELLPHSVSHLMMWPVRKLHHAFPGVLALISYSRSHGIPSWAHWCMKHVVPRLSFFTDNK